MLLGQWSISVILILRSVHYTCFHSVIKSGIVFEDNSSNSGKIFTLRKKIVRIMVGVQPRTSCRSLLKQLEILPVPCQYILSLTNFISNNQEIFQTNFLYTILIQGISIIFIDQMPAYLVFRNYILC